MHYYYQDLAHLRAQNVSETAIMDFVRTVVTNHRASPAYQNASDAELYYAKHNVTMERFRKFLYTANGSKIPDLISANYKLKSGFFRRAVTQQVQYVLSNGVTFQNEDTKDKLGKDFDTRLVTLATKGCVDGVSYAFWNVDHIEIFGFADTPNSPGFAPLEDEDSGLLRAGIRYWCIRGDTFRYTLYEEDGFTEYIKRDDEDMEVYKEKRPYVLNTITTEADGEEVVSGENYAGFPIVPFYANDLHESELNCVRDSIDCMDFIKSGLANEIDDTSGIYWVIKNAGGMDDFDMASWLQKLRTVRSMSVDSEDGGDAVPNTIAVPYEARAKMIEILEQDMYRDFQLLNVSNISASSKTATEIRAAYQPQDDKCSAFEYALIECIHRILELAGIDDEPSFRWNRIANQSEETQMIMTAATVLGDKLTLSKLPFLTSEEVQERLNEMEDESMSRMPIGIQDDEDEPEEDNGGESGDDGE